MGLDKKIFCTVWATIVTLVCVIFYALIIFWSIFIYFLFFILAFVRCFFYPCSLEKAPIINNCESLISKLRDNVNDELSWLATSTGFIFTSAKETGAGNTWDKYDIWVDTHGIVQQIADSTDGLMTIDFKLSSIHSFDNDSYTPAKCSTKFSQTNQKYLRAEVFPQILLNYTGRKINIGDSIQVKGRLYWDRDGFLEVHPEKGTDLKVF